MHVLLLEENYIKSVLSKFDGSLFPVNHFFQIGSGIITAVLKVIIS